MKKLIIAVAALAAFGSATLVVNTASAGDVCKRAFGCPPPGGAG